MRRWAWLIAVAMSGVAAARQPAEAGLCKVTPEAAQRMLSALRAQAHACGLADMPAAGALQWDERLAQSARSYAEELARRGSLSHDGQQARSLRERLRLAGYRMRLAGENLAAGPNTLDEALGQWLASPAHCDNLMAADFEQMGLACAAGAAPYGHYWVLHLGRSLPE
ncbi:MAG TPA: CAP domain-containing protein [Roseateles sp.]|nr:CAP domain-containing protein [Roseateles sp.]